MPKWRDTEKKRKLTRKERDFLKSQLPLYASHGADDELKERKLCFRSVSTGGQPLGSSPYSDEIKKKNCCYRQPKENTVKYISGS